MLCVCVCVYRRCVWWCVFLSRKMRCTNKTRQRLCFCSILVVYCCSRRVVVYVIVCSRCSCTCVPACVCAFMCLGFYHAIFSITQRTLEDMGRPESRTRTTNSKYRRATHFWWFRPSYYIFNKMPTQSCLLRR